MMSRKYSINFFTGILAIWVFTFSIISVGFFEQETVDQHGSVITKFHSYNQSCFASEPCEEKEVKDTGTKLPLAFSIVCVYPKIGIDNFLSNSSDFRCSISSFGNTTNLPLYLAKKSFLI